MSNDFFYQMNKKLQQVVEMPKSVNQQLNERANSKSVEEGMFDSLKQGMAKAGSVAKKVGSKALDTLGHGSDEQMRADLQRKMGLPPTGKKPQTIAFHKSNTVDDNAVVGKVKEEYGPLEEKPMTPKQKKFAKLAPPADKITFADKIAGAKKEVDEMLGDVAANAMRKAVKGKKVADEGSDWSQLGKEYSRPKIGTVDRGAKHDIEHTATGRRVTRRTDDQGMSVGADDEAGAEPAKRGRGRPKGSSKSIGAKGPNGKSKLMNKSEEIEEKAVSKKQQKFMGMVHAAQKGEKPASKEVAKVAKSMKKSDAKDFASTKHKGLPEKVKSKKSEGKKEKTEEAGGTGTPTASSGFAYGKGIYDSLNREIENLISENMALTVAEGMGDDIVRRQYDKLVQSGYTPEQAIMDIATRYKDNPEDIRRLVSGSTAQTPAARSAGALKQARQGLGAMHEGLNESMSINASDSTEGGKSLTITASDDDALKLAGILRNAGLGGSAPEAGDVEVVGIDSPISGDEGHEHEEGECPTCGSHDCGCGDIEEALAENEPDWPTEPETSDDALQYSGGLNGPKSTGQTTVPVIAHQGDRTGVDDEALRRLREMAGLVSEQEQVMAPEEIEEAKEMCEVCEATPCKCDESVEESIAKLRGLAGIQEAAKPDFTDVDDDGNEKESWKKAEQDKKEKEDKKVEESIFKMTNLWKSYKG